MSANRPYDDDDLPTRGYERRADPNRADREISLGTPTILGIFFVLALAFAAVFGLGYTMGHKSSQNPIAAVDPATGIAVTNAAKPNAGSLGAHPIATPVAQTTDQPPVSSAAAPQTATVALNPPATTKAANPADGLIAGDKIPTPAPQLATGNQQPATAFMVQVAAVSSQDVADILLASLQKKGYSVAVHREPQDKLLHVQIGPFADRKEAEAMRQRVLADGFNAIVK
jgi:cell division septation protein DedD